MSVNLRYPNITAVTPTEQITQIKSYLHQLVGQLNWALSAMESGTALESTEQPGVTGMTEESVMELKSLIAQSAAMLDSYYEKINLRLEGQYVPQSEFQVHRQELEGRYVSQAAFQGHTQAVWQRFEELAGQYVSQTDWEVHIQAAAETLTGLDGKFAALGDVQAYQQEQTQIMTELQRRIAEMEGRMDAMEETGGE